MSPFLPRFSVSIKYSIAVEKKEYDACLMGWAPDAFEILDYINSMVDVAWNIEVLQSNVEVCNIIRRGSMLL